MKTADSPHSSPDASPHSSPHYIGSDNCASCHPAEFSAWEKSQHRQAMQHADALSVLGDFSDARFSYAGIETLFQQRDDKYFVTTEGPEGGLTEYEIRYTFGVSPLQQYLVAFADGRLQALPIAWDTRPAVDGGQRWFHLYPDEKIDHSDELHWTKRHHNWNHMCADCHSTDVRKNFDISSNSFNTQWSELTVGCEACHGPASHHITWSQLPQDEKVADETRGLVVNYHERHGVSWAMEPQSGIATRSVPRTSHIEIDTCAQCHSRRAQIAENYRPGQPFTDHYLPTLPLAPLYHVDGQQRDEVYIWGSFLQSKMHQAGVTCADCHDPHSAKTRGDGNAVCAQCHLPTKFDTPTHHHHAVGTAGAQCVNCHMPQTTYMVNDPRRDHSFRPPRPDLSVAFDTPNACDDCHRDKPATWADTALSKWRQTPLAGAPQELAAAFFADQHGAADAAVRLQTIARDPARPAILRAAALDRLGQYPSPDMLAALREGLTDVDAMVRHASLRGLEALPPEQRLPLAAPLLQDPRRIVRIEAARILAEVPPQQMGADVRLAFAQADEEYIASHRLNADQAESATALAGVELRRGQPRHAEAMLQKVIDSEPSFVPAWVNLAELQRNDGRETAAEMTLRAALRAVPDAATLHHVLGLSLVRQQRLPEALPELAAAARAADTVPHFSYVYAVALHNVGRSDEALAVLDAQLALRPGDSAMAEARQSIARESAKPASVR